MTENILEQKWGKESLSMGWTSIPSSILFLQATLLISPNAMNVLLHLVMHWWDANKNPHPSQKAIANKMGVSVRTVQRALYELEEHQIISKQTTRKEHPVYRGRNIYDLSPLVRLLQELTPDLKQDVQRQQKFQRITQEYQRQNKDLT